MLTRENHLEPRGASFCPVARFLIKIYSYIQFCLRQHAAFLHKGHICRRLPLSFMLSPIIYCGGLKPRLIKIALSTLLIVFSLSSPMRSLSLRLSSVRICSNKITESFTSPYALLGSSICVGSLALLILLVTAAAIIVGEYLLPTSFCTIKTGRTPPCSLPTTGDKSA